MYIKLQTLALKSLPLASICGEQPTRIVESWRATFSCRPHSVSVWHFVDSFTAVRLLVPRMTGGRVCKYTDGSRRRIQTSSHFAAAHFKRDPVLVARLCRQNVSGSILKMGSVSWRNQLNHDCCPFPRLDPSNLRQSYRLRALWWKQRAEKRTAMTLATKLKLCVASSDAGVTVWRF